MFSKPTSLKAHGSFEEMPYLTVSLGYLSLLILPVFRLLLIFCAPWIFFCTLIF
jgi:hypothetical protein